MKIRTSSRARRCVLTAVLAAALGTLAAPLYAAEALPPAGAILDRYIQVTGGKAAYEARKTEIATGTLEFAAQGIKGTLTRYSADPDQYYSIANITGIGALEEGVTGGIAWEKSALLGARIKTGEERAQAVREARMNSSYHWRDLYAKAETTGEEQVNGEDCYKVTLTPKEGKPEIMYFEKKSGLLRRTTLVAASQMGDIPADLIALEYKNFGGLLEPSKVVQKAAGQEFTVTIDSVQANPPIPPARFALPPDVRALLPNPGN